MASQYDGPDYSPEKTEVSQRPTLLYPSGNAIFWDDFSEPNLAWVTGGTGTETVNLTTSGPFTPPNCISLKTSTTTSDSAFILKRFGMADTDKIGVEVAFNLQGKLKNIFMLQIKHVTPSPIRTMAVRYDVDNTAWEYFDTNGTWQTITGFSPAVAVDGDTYNRMKLVVDADAGNYVNVRVNNTFQDISSLTGRSTGTASSDYVEVTLEATTSAASSVTALVDNVTVTEE